MRELVERHRGINALFRKGLLPGDRLRAMERIRDSYVAAQNDLDDIADVHRENLTNWIDALTEKKISAGPLLTVIDDGIAFCGIDHIWSRRKGWAKRNFLAALSEYCRLETVQPRAQDQGLHNHNIYAGSDK